MDLQAFNELFENPALRSRKFKQEILIGDSTITFYPFSNITKEDPETKELITEVSTNALKIGCGCIIYNIKAIAGVCEDCKYPENLFALFTRNKAAALDYLICRQCMNMCNFCGKKICNKHSYYEDDTCFCRDCYREFLKIEEG